MLIRCNLVQIINKDTFLLWYISLPCMNGFICGHLFFLRCDSAALLFLGLNVRDIEHICLVGSVKFVFRKCNCWRSFYFLRWRAPTSFWSKCYLFTCNYTDKLALVSEKWNTSPEIFLISCSSFGSWKSIAMNGNPKIRHSVPSQGSQINSKYKRGVAFINS